MATNNSTNAGSVRDTAPGLDIFKTPENATFYSANLYHNLDKSKQEIRLIELSTQTGSEGILECKLLPAVLLADTRKQYLALSYCAGDPADTKEIMVNGVKCNVFANLHHALVLARRYWIQLPEQGPLRLWIDQLCINQHDLSERSHQVGFMRDIYQSAECTLACLSNSKTGGEGLKWFIDLCDAVPSKEDDKSFIYDRADDVETDGDPGLEDATRQGEQRVCKYDPESVDASRLKWFRICDYLWDHIHIEKFVSGWIAFYDVLSSPWWNRAWICQEFLVSSKVSFMFGSHFLSWEQGWKSMQAFCGTHRNYLTNRNNFQEFRNLSAGAPGDRQLCRILDIVKKRDLHRQIDHVGMALKMKIQWFGSMDIKSLLSHSRSCKSSDDRDRVYAILGLASTGFQIFPDYSQDMTAAQVMINTTKEIIDKEDSLYILVQATKLVRSRNLDVPSWVVDWSSIEALDMRNNYFGKRLLNQISCIPQETPQHTFETTRDKFQLTQAHILKVHGIFITRIWREKRQRIKIGRWLGTGKWLDTRKLLDSRQWPFADFTTPSGWQGGALASIADEDELWIVQGLKVPIVLRPYRDGYQVISCAFVVGQDGDDVLTPMISDERGSARRNQIILY